MLKLTAEISAGITNVFRVISYRIFYIILSTLNPTRSLLIYTIYLPMTTKITAIVLNRLL